MRTLLRRFDLRVSLAYIIAASLWIFTSDGLLALLFTWNPSLLITISALKGIGFVMVTGLALYAVLRAELRKRDQMERALQNDLAERIRTMEALRQSENRFATIFHNSPVPTSITRFEDAHLVDVNDAFVRLIGYNRDELIGRTANELNLWSYREKQAKADKAISEKGGIYGLEFEGRTKSGDRIFALMSSELIALDDKPHIVSLFYDVTKQKALEEQIRYQALLLGNVSDAVISTDLDFNIRSWNPAAEQIYGRQADEVIGKPVQGIVQGEYVDATPEEVIAQLQAQGTWRGEVIHQRKDGSRIHILASTSYITDGSGNRTGVVSVNKDITERKQAQQDIQEAKLREVKLAKEKELLQLKEHFISVVSHEFRTPLSVITSSTELVQRYADQMSHERQHEHLREVLAQTRFMVDLLDDVLTVNKARAGRLDFNPAPMDMIEFCQATLERMQAVNTGIHNFVFVHEGELSGVTLDAKLLQHILINLLSNAVKYSPEGGDVRLEVKRQNGAVMLRLSDQGIGIPEETLPKLYDPFVRADNTGDIGGTGLGMAIVKESVDLHKGTIACESQVGVGTTFTVTLPLPA